MAGRRILFRRRFDAAPHCGAAQTPTHPLNGGETASAATMFNNSYQAGFMSILYSIGSKPLQIWDKEGASFVFFCVFFVARCARPTSTNNFPHPQPSHPPQKQKHSTKKVHNGHIKRITDADIKSSVLEVMSSNVSTTFITCPAGGPSATLGIKLPFLVCLVGLSWVVVCVCLFVCLFGWVGLGAVNAGWGLGAGGNACLEGC